MANILITWELGWGLGHLALHREPALRLAAQGHRVVFAARQLRQAHAVFRGTPVSVVQAPQTHGQPADEIELAMAYGQLLHNMGYADADELAGLVHGWRGLFDLVDPDLLVADHSPTALLASRGHRTRRLHIGNGFSSPPDEQPIPSLIPGAPDQNAEVATSEDRVMDRIAKVLADAGLPALSHLGRLFSDLDDTVLTTFAELDHYPNRVGAEYWGDWTSGDLGAAPDWPPGEGPRIFAYLKPFPAVGELLAALGKRGCPTLVYAPALPRSQRDALRGPSLHFSDVPFAIDRVGEECDLAILNGTHGTTLKMLLAGKPILQIPLVLEQGLTGVRVERMGAGLQQPGGNPAPIVAALDQMLDSPKFSTAAQSFAARYHDYDPAAKIDAYVARLERLL